MVQISVKLFKSYRNSLLMENLLTLVKHELKSILIPDWRKLAIFTVLSLICIGGVIQSYAFIDEILGIPKPPLYDLLKPFSIWPAWVLLVVPLYILSHIFNLTYLVDNFPPLGGVKTSFFSVLYSYILSCWSIYVWDKWLKTDKLKYLILALGVFTAFAINPPIILTSFPEGASYILSGFILISITMILYSIALYGFIKFLSSLVKILYKRLGSSNRQ